MISCPFPLDANEMEQVIRHVLTVPDQARYQRRQRVWHRSPAGDSRAVSSRGVFPKRILHVEAQSRKPPHAGVTPGAE